MTEPEKAICDDGIVRNGVPVRCSVEKGHKGTHMHIGENGTTVWGWVGPVKS